MAANAGYAVLQVIPSVRGISEELRRQLVAPAADAGDQAGQQAAGGFREKFKAGMVAAGAVAGAALVAATVSAVEKEKVGDRLAAQLGLSGKGAQRAGKIAGNLYGKAVTDSFEDAADTVRAVMGSGLVDERASTKAIEGISTKVADLAKTFDQDLAGTANAAAQMIRTGLAKDGAQALDLITKGFQSGANKADDFLDTINEYGTQFRKMGLDGAASIGLLNQAIAAGARDSDVAADAIKEFSIRAVDGSESTKDGFKAIGLEADTMAARFGKGGKTATAALDLTLDRLRAMKDPVEQEAAAVALFGTQAEDLGKALFAMDPSSAADGLGKVGGAAKRVGDTIRGNTATEIEILKRQFTSLLGGVVQAVVLPGLRGLIVVVKAVTSAIAASVRWIRDYGAWFLPLIVAVGGLTVALNASAIATAAVTAVFSVYRAVILASTAITQGFAAAQALLNSIMALNPVTLIVIALLALGTALVVAWKKSDTFRAIVMAAWNGIKAAAMATWTTVLKPALAGIVIAARAVGSAALWMWRSAILPAFKGIWLVARTLFAIVATAVLFPLIAAFKLVGAVATWLWKNAISPVIGLITAGFKLWWAGAKLYLSLVIAGFRAVGAVAKWLWHNTISPVIGFIVAGFKLWWAGAKLYFGLVMGGLRVVGAGFTWLWTNAIRPAFDGIKATISTVWNRGIRPVFDALGRGVSAVGDAFKAAVRFIGRVWDGLKAVARRPVQFVVDTVYNNGIRKVWNTVAGLVGLDKLEPVRFDDGGRTSGGTPGKDSIPALLMADEYVIKRDSARKVGFGALEYINATGQLPGFAEGGRVVDWLKDSARTVGSWIGDGVDFLAHPGRAWETATAFIRDKIATLGSGTEWIRAVAKLPVKLLTAMKDKVVGAAQGLFGGAIDVGGSGVQRWAPLVRQVLGLLGLPGSALGPVLTRIGIESGGNPRAINNWDINAQRGIASRGLMQTIPPTFNAYAGPFRGRGIFDPLANIYAGVNYARHRYGSNWIRVMTRPGGYDSGGLLPPGYQSVYNGTRKPEAVLTAAQWDAMFAAARGGMEPRQVQVMPGARVELREAVDVDMLADRLEFAARSASF